MAENKIDIKDAMPGDYISVTWGKEVFWPGRDTGWELGPFTYTTQILPYEDATDAFKRAWKKLDSAAEKVFEAKRKGFAKRAEKIKSGA